MRTTLIALLALAVIAPTANAARKPTYAQLVRQVRTLKVTNSKLRTQRNTAVARASAYASRVSTLTTEKATLAAQVPPLTAQVSTLTSENARITSENARIASENTGLKGALPDQVAAVARTGVSADLQTYVLIPAHNGWACRGSIFYGTTFFSFDFNRRAPDGTCY